MGWVVGWWWNSASVQLHRWVLYGCSTGEKVGKGGELLVQVLTQGVEFTLDGSGGGLLLEYCGVPRVSGRSQMWVATL